MSHSKFLPISSQMQMVELKSQMGELHWKRLAQLFQVGTISSSPNATKKHLRIKKQLFWRQFCHIFCLQLVNRSPLLSRFVLTIHDPAPFIYLCVIKEKDNYLLLPILSINNLKNSYSSYGRKQVRVLGDGSTTDYAQFIKETIFNWAGIDLRWYV